MKPKLFTVVDGVQVSLYSHMRAIGRGTDYQLVINRMLRGWSMDDAISKPRRAYNVNEITPRQREVWSLLAHGKVDKEIARKLGISLSTVDIHLANVLQRTGSRNRVEAALKFHGINVQ